MECLNHQAVVYLLQVFQVVLVGLGNKEGKQYFFKVQARPHFVQSINQVIIACNGLVDVVRVMW